MNLQINTRREKTALYYLVIALLLALFMMPFIMVIINSFKTNRDIIKHPLSIIADKGYSLTNYVSAFTNMHFMRSLGNSVLITGTATLLILLFSGMTAYYMVRWNNRYSKIVFSAMVVSMIVPFQVMMIPIVSIYGARLNLFNNRLTLIFMHLGFGISLSTFMYHGAIKGGVPLALEEAAKLDGASRLQTYFQVVLPLLKSTSSTLAVLNVLSWWNDYLLPSLVLTKKQLFTLPLSTYSFYGTYSTDYGSLMAGLVLVIIPLLVLFLLLQKQVIRGVVEGAIK